jgi:Flp pilus assembly protein TadD
VKRLLTGLVFAAVLLVLAGCGDKDKGKNREQKDRPKSTPDKTALVTPGR